MAKGPLKSLGIGEFGKGPFTKPLTRKRLRREVRAARKLQFGPLRREIRGEIRASREQERRAQDYFKGYKQALSQQAAQTRGAYGQADTQISQQAQAASNYAEQLRQRLGTEEASEAAKYGQSSIQREGGETNIAAQLARLNASNILRGVTASQGATQEAYTQRSKDIANRELVEQRLREAARRRSYRSDLRDVAKQEGALGVDFLRQARGSERDFYLGLLGVAGSRAGRRLQKTLQKSSQRHESKEAAKSRKFEASQAKKDRRAEARGGGKEPLSPAEKRQRRQNKRERTQNRQEASQALKANRPVSKKKNIHDLSRLAQIGYLMETYDIPRKVAERMVNHHWKAWKGPPIGA